MLREQFAARAAAGEMVPGTDWCAVGDALLLANDVEGAEACYDQGGTDPAAAVRAAFGRVAVLVDRGRIAEAASLARAQALGLETAPHPLLAATVRRIADLWTSRLEAAPPRAVEVAIFAHVSEKLVRNKALGAPGVGLVELSTRGLREHFGIGAGDKVTVLYDHRETDLNRAFRDNLAAFCERQGFGLVVNDGRGLRRQWLRAFSMAAADVVFVVEQDHEFRPGAPSFARVLEAFAARPDVNYIRISRQRLRNWGFDCLLSRTPRDEAVGVSRAWLFSNTPHFLRRDFYDAVVRPIIDAAGKFDGGNKGAAGRCRVASRQPCSPQPMALARRGQDW